MKKLLSLLVVTVCSLVVIAGCASKNSVKIGDQVSIIYTATFSDGHIFEQNNEQTPFNFTVGSGDVIHGLEEGVIGMKIGHTKTITIKPDKGYGKLYNANNIQKVSQLIFDKLSITTKNGTIQKLGNIEGIVKGTEQDGSGNTLVLFDINPRQTWDTLKYKVKLLNK